MSVEGDFAHEQRVQAHAKSTGPIIGGEGAVEQIRVAMPREAAQSCPGARELEGGMGSLHEILRQNDLACPMCGGTPEDVSRPAARGSTARARATGT